MESSATQTSSPLTMTAEGAEIDNSTYWVSFEGLLGLFRVSFGSLLGFFWVSFGFLWDFFGLYQAFLVLFRESCKVLLELVWVPLGFFQDYYGAPIWRFQGLLGLFLGPFGLLVYLEFICCPFDTLSGLFCRCVGSLLGQFGSIWGSFGDLLWLFGLLLDLLGVSKSS